MSPNSSGIHFGQKIYIDQYGFRVPSKDFFYKKNNKSIFIIGDSTAFGNGIPEQKTFVGKLRGFFRACIISDGKYFKYIRSNN